MTLQEIANYINIDCDSQIEITGLNTLLDAHGSEITFLENKKYVMDLEKTNAAAVLIKEEFVSLLVKSQLFP